MLTAVDLLAPADALATAGKLRETVKVANGLEEENPVQAQPMTETVKAGSYSLRFPLNVPGTSSGSFYSALKPLVAEDPQGTTATVLELKNETVLSEAILALANIFLR
jgi:hypothetical protein